MPNDSLVRIRPLVRAVVPALIVAAALGSLPRPARAQSGDACRVLYGVDSGSDSLSVVDLDGRTVTIVGPVGNINPIAIATRPSDGQVFVWDNAISSLMTVDTCTGRGTELRDPSSANIILYDLVFTPEGRLFGLGNAPYELDPETGQVHGMGGFRDQDGRQINLVSASAYAPDGRLFAVAHSNVELVPIDLGLLDPYTGTFTFVSRLTLPETDGPQDLFFSPDGTLYLIVLRNFEVEQMHVFRVDPGSGDATLVWRSRSIPQSVAYAPACGVPIDACRQRVTDIVVDHTGSIGRGSAVIRWTTVGETDIEGFNVVSIDDLGARTRMTVVPVPCEECITGASHTYEFFIPKHRSSKNLFIETVRVDGRIETYGPAERR
ncbi:MAG TPA: hypothetical protein VGV60_04645 [Candidatus Polarisedimenticolia bacterium]|nr:hypothetical protein [Candidatus Polarisedimenticolia bacterium]